LQETWFIMVKERPIGHVFLLGNKVQASKETVKKKIRGK